MITLYEEFKLMIKHESPLEILGDFLALIVAAGACCSFVLFALVVSQMIPIR